MPGPDRPDPADAVLEPTPRNFIEEIIEQDNATRKWGTWQTGEIKPGGAQVVGAPRVHTRFPPEPNGYLHIGHAKSIWLNFGVAKKYGGKFNLRFDDTNPAKEEQEYVDAIKADVKWLGADWEGPYGGGLHFASDDFGFMYDCAVDLIRKGKAYVCDLSAEEVAKRRGTPGVPATSPFRDRPAEESLRLIQEMRDGKWPNGAKTVRAKIDLASPNFNLRDPVMYRILHEEHHNTGGKWCIYPMYDWAHGFEDSLEQITHSLCTLEFEDHRPLYDWFIDAVNEGRSGGDAVASVSSGHGHSAHSPTAGAGAAAANVEAAHHLPPPSAGKIWHPQQIEFAKFRPTYTVLSKRNLLKMVQEGTVRGWDDPRMPTLSGLRRRGYTPEAIWNLCDQIGVTKFESHIDITRLENAIRDDLNKRAPRRMAVLNPLRVVIENYPEGKSEELEAVNNPEDPSAGTRKVPFSRVLYIEQDDFLENPPKKFFRMTVGREVRLRYAYFITCTSVVKDEKGQIVELRVTYDPATRGGDAPDGRKVKATLHWVSAAHAVNIETRLFDRLFKVEEPGKATGNYLDDLNPDSLRIVTALAEPSLGLVKAGDKFQFERQGYFCADPDSRPGSAVFNRTVTLKDTWAKMVGQE